MKKAYPATAGYPYMNHDRSVKSVVWDKFPKMCRLFLEFVEDRIGPFGIAQFKHS